RGVWARVCQAAGPDGGQPAAPVRCHDDEIAAPVRGRCNNGLIGSRVRHLHRVAGHAGLLGCIGRPTQHIRGVFLDLFVMFGKVFKCLPLRRSRFWNAKPVERLLDDNYGYLGSHGFRPCQSICYCMLRQLRPICWNENMPVHAPPLDCSGDCFTYPNCACNFLSKINLSVNRTAVQCLALAVSSRMSASLIGRFGYTFRLSTTVAGMLLAGSCFSSEFTAFILFCLGVLASLRTDERLVGRARRTPRTGGGP